MTHISIIVVHYNNEADTHECLASLTALKTGNEFSYSVLVVDNGSKQPLTLSSSLPAKKFDLVRSEANLGFTGGNNLGIYTAIEKFGSDFVLLLNNDTVVDSSFLYHLHKMAISNVEFGLLSPKIYFHKGNEFFKNDYPRSESGNVLWYAGGSIDWRHVVMFHRGVDQIDRGQFDAQQMSDFATGCCLLIRREILEKIGPLDKRYFLYLEDVDLNLRAVNAGYSIGFCPESEVWHKNAGSSDGSGSQVHLYYQTRNRILFVFKHRTIGRLLTLARLIWNFMLNGTSVERTAVVHALTNQYGKQPLV